jgi:ferredoxin
MTLKVTIDRDMCEDSGICWKLLPQVFSANPYGYVIMEHVPEELRLQVQLAVMQCPAAAIASEPE